MSLSPLTNSRCHWSFPLHLFLKVFKHSSMQMVVDDRNQSNGQMALQNRTVVLHKEAVVCFIPQLQWTKFCAIRMTPSRFQISRSVNIKLFIREKEKALWNVGRRIMIALPIGFLRLCKITARIRVSLEIQAAISICGPMWSCQSLKMLS